MTQASKLLITGAAVALMCGAASTTTRAADLGKGGANDLEDRVAELEATAARKGNRAVTLQVSGQVNRALLIWDDGTDSDAYVVDPDSDGSRFRFTGEAKIKPGWSAGYIMEMNVVDSASNRVSQLDDEGLNESNGFSIRQNAFYIESEQLGRVTLGQASQPTDGINEIDIVATYATVSKTHYAGNFLVRTHDGDLTAGDANGVRWQDVLGAIGGTQEDIIRYDSPSIYGFIVSASWGDNDIWDASLRFAKEWNSIKLAAGIGYLKDNRDEAGFNIDSQLSGSASAIHVPSGLFATVAAGRRTFDDDSPDATNWYVKGGISKNWTGYGATTLFADYAHFNDFGVGARRDIDGSGIGSLDTITGSESNVFGFGIVQGFDSAALNIYAVAQFYDTDIEANIGDVNSDDHFALILGSHIKF
ncbi:MULTISPECIES: hypothetical protein [Rhodomicrobium]|uniref:porin n=1 Tax=Rhodomicrobium TaxID=1068 RepID=UPI000F7412FD|nr:MULTISPECIES: hypothetical protein [Rhodomicrobium]